MTDGSTVVGDRYQLLELIGRGGMAEVHRGRDLRLGRPVAVKLLSGALAADATAHTRFRREAQAAASLNDATIAAVFDTGEDTDPGTGVTTPYIVMELVEGATLRRLLDDGPLPAERALQITGSVLDALATSHDAGIVHRDIKPANVMVTPAGAVKVMDFGIARAVDDTSSHLTQTSAVIGTAGYLSPEQARGETVDSRSDLYSVGCLLFELLTGRPPFVGESSISVAYQHVREAPAAPSSLVPGLPAGVDAVVLHALAKDPAERYPDARAMHADVDRLLGSLAEGSVPTGLVAAVPADATVLRTTAVVPPVQPTPVVAAVVDPVVPAAEPERRHVARRVLLGTLVTLLVLGLGAFGLTRLLGTGETATAAVVVPPVVGSTRAAADSALRDAGLVPRFRDVTGKAGKSVGTVTKQDPPGGGSVPRGTAVTLEVNAGPASGTIPDGLVGEDVATVEKALERAEFSDVKTKAVDPPTDDATAGEVVSVDPEPGTAVALDDRVTVRYVREDPSGSSSASTSDDGSGSSGGGDDDGQDDDAGTSTAPEPSDSPEPTTSEQPTTSTSPEPSASDEPTSSSPAPSTSPKPSPSPSASESGGGGGKGNGKGGGGGKGGGNAKDDVTDTSGAADAGTADQGAGTADQGATQVGGVTGP